MSRCRIPRAALLGGVVIAVALVLAACPDPDERVAELEEDVDALAAELGEKDAEIAEKDARIAELEAELAEWEEEAEAMRLPQAETVGTRTGLEDALRTYFRPGQPEFERGVTSWEPSDLEIPERYRPEEGAWQSPGDLMTSLVRAVGGAGRVGAGWGDHDDAQPSIWEITFRALHIEEGEALGIIQHWGLPDDSLMGRDWLFRLALDETGWHIVSVQERAQCRRGVTDDACV